MSSGAFKVIHPSPLWTKMLLKKGCDDKQVVFVIIQDSLGALESGVYGIGGNNAVKNLYIKRAMDARCQPSDAGDLYTDPYTTGVLAMDADISDDLMVSDMPLSVNNSAEVSKLYYSRGIMVQNSRLLDTFELENKSETLYRRMIATRGMIMAMSGSGLKEEDIRKCFLACCRSNEEISLLSRFMEEVFYQRKSKILDLFVGYGVTNHQYVVKHLDPISKLGEEPQGGKALWDQVRVHQARLVRKIREQDELGKDPKGTQLASLNNVCPESVDYYEKAPDGVEPGILSNQVRSIYMTLSRCIDLAKKADDILEDWIMRRDKLRLSCNKRRRVTRSSKYVKEADIPLCVACGMDFGEYDDKIPSGTVLDVFKFDCNCKSAIIHRVCFKKLVKSGPLNACPMCKNPLAQTMGTNSPVGKMSILPCRSSVAQCGDHYHSDEPLYMVILECDKGRFDVFSDKAFVAYPEARMVFYVPYCKKGKKIVECLVQMWKLHRLLYMSRRDGRWYYSYRVPVSDCPSLGNVDKDFYCQRLLDQCQKELTR